MRYDAPGVYVEEIPSGVRTIAQVSTSVLAVVDDFERGPIGDPRRITSLTELERTFGGLQKDSLGGYALHLFFLNGGSEAWVVRVAKGMGAGPSVKAAEEQAGAQQNDMTVVARSPGAWGNDVHVGFHVPAATGPFDMIVREYDGDRVVASEVFRGLSTKEENANHVAKVVCAGSTLVTVRGPWGRPDKGTTSGTVTDVEDLAKSDLFHLADGAAAKAEAADVQAGLQTLDTIAPFRFNLMALPGVLGLGDSNQTKAVYAFALKFCRERRAMLLVDTPEDRTHEDVHKWAPLDGLRDPNTVTYFPWVRFPDPLDGYKPRPVPPSGAVAGIFARTDATRGVWKAPAGTDAKLRGADPARALTERQNGALNSLGINVLRSFPVHGPVVWGSRTLYGADDQASEWKYVPVRRMALFIEESLSQGLKWAVFEPNDEPLWSQIRMNVGAFLQTLHRQGAFEGASARDAYFVKCDAQTTTPTDRNSGFVNIVVGFAPLKPAEFVVLKIQQLAGQAQS